MGVKVTKDAIDLGAKTLGSNWKIVRSWRRDDKNGGHPGQEAYMTTLISSPLAKIRGELASHPWSSLLHHLSNSGRFVVSKRRWPSNTVSTSRVRSRTR